MSYCAACNGSVAREDRVEVDGEVYHRSCAPDEAVGLPLIQREDGEER